MPSCCQNCRSRCAPPAQTPPCGSYDWTVYRLGADIGLECLRCKRRVLLPPHACTQAKNENIKEENNRKTSYLLILFVLFSLGCGCWLQHARR
jgi:hypothetical protein